MRPTSYSTTSNLVHKWDASVDDDDQYKLPWNNVQSPFGADDLPLSAFWVHDPVTWLDTTSFVKGGANAKGGGKTTGGSGGGTGTTDPSIVGTYLAGAGDGEAGYDIRIDFKGTGWTDSLKKAFTDSADYFTKVIISDIGGGKYYNNIYVDDLYMTAELKTIDGTGGILGQSGPTAIWGNELTEAGLTRSSTPRMP